MKNITQYRVNEKYYSVQGVWKILLCTGFMKNITQYRVYEKYYSVQGVWKILLTTRCMKNICKFVCSIQVVCYHCTKNPSGWIKSTGTLFCTNIKSLNLERTANTLDFRNFVFQKKFVVAWKIEAEIENIRIYDFYQI